MKRVTVFLFAFIVLAAAGVMRSNAGFTAPQRERAVVEFDNTVKLMGVLLRGSYVIVHDEERMAKGEPCTYIYRSKNGKEAELVTSFHCEHVDRAKAKAFTVRYGPRPTLAATPEVLEFQFGGSTAGHRVPSE